MVLYRAMACEGETGTRDPSRSARARGAGRRAQSSYETNLRARAMLDHATLWDNIWLVGGIALGGGGFGSQVFGTLLGDLGFGVKLLVTLGIAGIIFGTMYFLGPAPHA